MDTQLFNSEFIKQKLEKAPYNETLGIRLIRIANMDVSGKLLTLIAVKLDPGKQLVPHLHEFDGEICIPLTDGVMTLGQANKDKNGAYILDKEDKILVKWGKPQKIKPGKPIEIAPAEAHHLYAPGDKPVIVFFLLPASHLDTDKKFVVYPKLK